jgi:glycosyltransferase involved in cell wall biosynthesis
VKEGGLDDVLVLTVRKGFWASSESEIFPRRLYTATIRGPSHSLVNSGALLLRALVEIWRRPPRVVLVGYAHRTVPWLARLRRLGLLRGARIVITNWKGLPDRLVRRVDRIVEYSRNELELRSAAVRERAVVVPLPATGDFDGLAPAADDGEYAFAGGGGLRDFASAIEAVRGLDARLLVVTFSRETLGYDDDLPPNCEVRYRMPLDRFLALLAGARLVVAPLQPGSEPHGQTTVVQALRLGKAIVATRDASLEDYVSDGVEGLLVDAGDVAGYRAAIDRLWHDDELRASCERAARARAHDLTYGAFAGQLAAICRDVMEA